MRLIWYILLFTVQVLFGSCMRDSGRNDDDLKQISVGITSSFLGEAATFIAQDKGFFKEEGLEVTLKYNDSGSESIRDLFNHRVDIAHVAETPIIYALIDTSYSKGATPPFQVFANLIYADQVQKIIARKDFNITRPEDIIGKKVALAKGTQLEYYLDSFLLEHQISKDKLTLVNMNSRNQIEALVEGSVDVSVNWEPYATYTQEQLGAKGTALNTKLHYSSLWMATTLNAFAQSNPGILVSYLEALKKAQFYIDRYPEETKKLLSTEVEVPVTVVNSIWHKIDYGLSMSERMISLFEDQERWLIRQGKADTSNFNYMDIINLQPINTVYPEGITIIHEP